MDQGQYRGVGGDPDNITVFGQSAGGVSITGLMAWGFSGSLMRRGIVQSGAAPMSSRADMEAASKEFAKLLGADPRKATVAQILAAQVALTKSRKGGDPGWRPVLPAVSKAPNIPLVCGWNREDASPHVLIEDFGNQAPDPAMDYARFAEMTKVRYEVPTRALAAKAATAGQKVWLYLFAWNGPRTGLGDCHTLELAFLLGSKTAWQDAPMLKGADWKDIERLGRQMRMQWASFARSGDPAAGGPAWKLTTASAQPQNILA